MTDKQIIIDGVDVSECADYDEDVYFTCQACGVCKCSELPNCYFKQLNRKTQECDRLKAENKTQKETIDGFLTVLGMLGENNIKLRETFAEIKEIAQGYEDTPNLECKQSCCTEILQKISEVNDDIKIS